MKRKSNPLHVEIYQDRKKQWRWRMKRCGRILADSGEGYKRMRDLEAALVRLACTFGSGDYILTDPHHRAKPCCGKCA